MLVQLNHCSTDFLFHLSALGVFHDGDSVASARGYCEGLAFDVVQGNCVLDAGKCLFVLRALVLHSCSHFDETVFDSLFKRTRS